MYIVSSLLLVHPHHDLGMLLLLCMIHHTTLHCSPWNRETYLQIHASLAPCDHRLLIAVILLGNTGKFWAISSNKTTTVKVVIFVRSYFRDFADF